MPIDPLSAPSLPPQPSPAPAARAVEAASFRATMQHEDRVELSAGVPGAPPGEVLDEIGAAARAYEDLRSRGRELRFGYDGRSGLLVIEVRDLDGRVLQRIPPTEALAVASGRFR